MVAVRDAGGRPPSASGGVSIVRKGYVLLASGRVRGSRPETSGFRAIDLDATQNLKIFTQDHIINRLIRFFRNLTRAHAVVEPPPVNFWTPVRGRSLDACGV